MDLKEIKQVIDLMKRAELTEFDLEKDDFKLHLSRLAKDVAPQIIQAAPISATPAAVAGSSSLAPEDTTKAVSKQPVEEKGIELIKSPMVGTFYSAPSPDSPVFAAIGSKVSPDTVVCIIEAMKVMNEIQSEISGSITEILVENGDAIEFGQPLFKVKTT